MHAHFCATVPQHVNNGYTILDFVSCVTFGFQKAEDFSLLTCSWTEDLLRRLCILKSFFVC